MIGRTFVAMSVTAALVSACGPAGAPRPASSPAHRPSPTSAVVADYPDLGQPVNLNSPSEALLAPSNLTISCADDQCTVSATLTNESNRARMSGRLAVTVIDKLTNGVLAECYARPSARLDPNASADVSCPLDRKRTAGHAAGTVELQYQVDQVSFSLQ